MRRLLNRALNFAVLPPKLNITQILVDFNRFAQSAILQDYWYGMESEKLINKLIFKKKKKNNLPKNHKTPIGPIPSNQKSWIKETEMKQNVI